MGEACGRHIMVTATEKQGTAFVFDVSIPASPDLLFVQHLSPASETKNPSVAYDDGTLGEARGHSRGRAPGAAAVSPLTPAARPPKGGPRVDDLPRRRGLAHRIRGRDVRRRVERHALPLRVQKGAAGDSAAPGYLPSHTHAPDMRPNFRRTAASAAPAPRGAPPAPTTRRPRTGANFSSPRP